MSGQSAAQNKLLVDRVRETIALALKSPYYQRALFEKKKYADTVPEYSSQSVTRMFIEDLSSIPFLKNISGIEYYQQRIRILASSGDLVVLTEPMDEDYETYNRHFLQLGSPTFIDVTPRPGTGMSVVENALSSPNFHKYLQILAQKNRELHIHPYMGSPAVWRIAEYSLNKYKLKTKIHAPLPGISSLVNNKNEFMELVRNLCGPAYVPEYLTARSISALSKNVRQLAHRFNKIVLKLPDCASSMGTKVFNRSEILSLTGSELQRRITHLLQSMEWDHQSAVVVSKWYDNVVQSPSVQLWLPPLSSGYPTVEGIYEQILEGEEKVFNGSMPAQLEPALEKELTEMSYLLAVYIQQLGYIGRCSFDTIITSGDRSAPAIKFVECNGRWGGTSLPMSLIFRLFSPTRYPYYQARDYISPCLRGKNFAYLLEKMGDQCYSRNNSSGRYIFYNVGGLAQHGKLDVIILGENSQECQDLWNSKFSVASHLEWN
ncbi:hypothetical protein ACFL27_04195 [candidate division CSSED10-310 bacterium]|uniref:Pre ATP-grasp domain-containing protein n=1 Tax=candidate division CSSED10-310 bacterium TaxID=2855610 RepID=A0ABV6YTH5_UNCC1